MIRTMTASAVLLALAACGTDSTAPAPLYTVTASGLSCPTANRTQTIPAQVTGGATITVMCEWTCTSYGGTREGVTVQTPLDASGRVDGVDVTTAPCP